jgi:hypothetical protein
MSVLVAHFQIFRVKFDVLWPSAKKFQNWIVDQSTAREFTVSEYIYVDYLLFIILYFRFAIKICIHTKPKKHPYPPQRCHHVSHIVVKELLNHALFVAFWFLTKLPQTYPPAINSSFQKRRKVMKKSHPNKRTQTTTYQTTVKTTAPRMW